MSETAAPEISPREVADRRDDPDLFVLDVRNEDDVADWPIEGAHNLPIYDQLLDHDFSGLEAGLDELPTDREIAVVCVGGVTSARAANWLRERGYDARSMTDGMRGWGRAHRPFEVDAVEGVVQVVRPGTGCVSHLVHDGGEAVVVDPSIFVGVYEDLAADLGVELVGAVDTHAHADHVSGGRRLAADYGIPYYLHPDDAGSLTEYEPVEDGDRIPVGDRDLAVLFTPGHTPGSVSLRFGDALLAGDTLFIRGVGRPDLEGSDEDEWRGAARDLHASLRRLSELPDETVVLPGHFSDEDERPLTRRLGALQEENELFGTADEDAFVDRIVAGLSATPGNYQQIKRINWGEEPLTEEAADLELGPNNCAAN
ncbi:MBL fold metallo-hydrolase [Halobacteriales archaeon QS_8_69_26]|nr:MAG: MBL fold metallo-hydrolase [Halobacteriales archaeon QS_8_69_26]